jgi:hypothetical protein
MKVIEMANVSGDPRQVFKSTPILEINKKMSYPFTKQG